MLTKTSVYEVGNTLSFEYNGKVRHVRVEKVNRSTGNCFIGPVTLTITGWDFLANHPTGGYRTFTVSKITGPVTVC